ncbi:MAG: IS1380 family transposase [Acidimicrobiales bacterium]
MDAVLAQALARAWQLGAGPGDGALVIDLDSTITEVHGKAKGGAAYGYTRQLGYHPLLATRAGTGEVLFSRLRKGSAGSGRGVVRFVDELVAVVARAGATGAMTVRADAGFWSWKLIDRLNAHGIAWSITVTRQPSVRRAIDAIPDDAWVDIDYTLGGRAQVAETTYTASDKGKGQTVRLVVRRTRFTDRAQQRLWPDWRHHAFITNTALDAVAADEFHRNHAVVELTIRDLKEGAGLEHMPSGRFHANGAWLAAAVLAHNLNRWTLALADQPAATNQTLRTRVIALAAVVVNRSGRPTLRLPARWPWAKTFTTSLTAMRALPAPSG